MYEKVDKQKIRNTTIAIIKQEKGKVNFKTYQMLFKDPRIKAIIQKTSCWKVDQFKLICLELFKDGETIRADQQGVRWIKKYPEIHNYTTLYEQVSKRPEGFKVNQFIQENTYYNAKADINRLLDEKKLKKINGQKKTEYFLFPTILQRKNNIQEANHETYFGTSDYLTICKQQTRQAPAAKDQEEDKKKATKIKSSKYWNSWVEGYAIEKQIWMRKNFKK